VHPKAVIAGQRYGLHLADAPTSRVDQVQRRSDLVVAVCDNAHEELDPSTPRLHWAIPDPVRLDTDAAFDAAFDQISRRVDALANAVPELA
jgi:ArsR family transcriptional regulator, arsenate/arsenite/antimonite-responsive transcriptional repressor / arsenate reductase (thioredoxin)